MTDVAKGVKRSYRITDLDYPAIAVKNISVLIGAKLSDGQYYAFGKSKNAGVSNLVNYYRNVMRRCGRTKWVLAGYSQGAMVVAEAARQFNASDVVYLGLFGDPQLNLPEGKGLSPLACSGRNLSVYRVNVPNCRTHTGVLGARKPYVPGKMSALQVGLWCNNDDFICGSTSNPAKLSGHMQYAKQMPQLAQKVRQRLLVTRF